MLKDNMSFEGAYSTLIELVQAIEQDQIPLKDLSEKVKEAKLLLDFCAAQLQNVENSIDKAAETQ